MMENSIKKKVRRILAKKLKYFRSINYFLQNTKAKMNDFIIKKETLNEYFNTDKFIKDYTLADFGYEDVKLETYENQLKAIKKYGDLIRYIENPSEEIQELAVKQNGLNIQYIINPAHLNVSKPKQQFCVSEEIQKLAVQDYGMAIKYIENPSEEVQKLAIQQDCYAIEYIENPSEEIQELAIKQSSWIIKYIENPSEKIQKLAVQEDGIVIRYIENPCGEVKKLAVQQNGSAIEYIENPSEELQKIAVKQDSDNIICIMNPAHLNVSEPKHSFCASEEVQKIAIRKDSDYIHYIKKPSKEIIRFMITNNYFSRDNIAKYVGQIFRYQNEKASTTSSNYIDNYIEIGDYSIIPKFNEIKKKNVPIDKIKSINKKIIDARKSGNFSTILCTCNYKLKNELVELYEKNGYNIVESNGVIKMNWE